MWYRRYKKLTEITGAVGLVFCAGRTGGLTRAIEELPNRSVLVTSAGSIGHEEGRMGVLVPLPLPLLVGTERSSGG